ncbi:hypothetical protein D3C81_1586060 [compost metagenome]
MDSSLASRSISLRYRSAAIQRASSSTSRVAAAVTLGLPSRSPPIQEAKRIGIAFGGRRLPVAMNSASSTSRSNSGKARHSEFSMTAKPHLASSTGVGRWRRISPVCQAPAMISRRRREISPRSVSGRPK